MLRRFSAIILTCILMITTLAGCTTDSSQYKKAVELYNSGKYDEAYEIFSQLGYYKDSMEYRLKENIYRAALRSMDEEDYHAARKYVYELAEEGYRDSADILAYSEEMIEKEEARERYKEENMYYDESTGEWYEYIDTSNMSGSEIENQFGEQSEVLADWLNSQGLTLDDWERIKEFGDDWYEYPEDNW